MAFLGIHRHAAVVAHVFVTARRQVEKRCLATVGITDKGDPDGTGFVGIVILLGTDVDKGGFVTPEGDLVTHYLIFDGILERGVKDGVDLLPGNEAHLDEPFPEVALSTYLYDYP